MARSTEASPRACLEALGLAEPAVCALDAYLGLLSAWSRKVNLTAARSPAARVDLLIRDVLPLIDLLAPGDIMDVGSGNGSPGLILGVLAPDRAVTLLEPRMRRFVFLREAARAVGRPDIQVLRLRHDEVVAPPVANLTVRALRVPAPELARLMAPGGRILALGALPPGSEGFRARQVGIAGRGFVHVLERGDVPRETVTASEPPDGPPGGGEARVLS
ncbi:MAG TPA: RsmG family class I SAM-dependent methyltransferase [Vicinamibacteria bacterium]